MTIFSYSIKEREEIIFKKPQRNIGQIGIVGFTFSRNCMNVFIKGI